MSAELLKTRYLIGPHAPVIGPTSFELDCIYVTWNEINPARNPFSYEIIFLDNPCSKSSENDLSECSKISSISKTSKCAKNGILITSKILSCPNEVLIT